MSLAARMARLARQGALARFAGQTPWDRFLESLSPEQRQKELARKAARDEQRGRQAKEAAGPDFQRALGLWLRATLAGPGLIGQGRLRGRGIYHVDSAQAYDALQRGEEVNAGEHPLETLLARVHNSFPPPEFDAMQELRAEHQRRQGLPLDHPENTPYHDPALARSADASGLEALHAALRDGGHGSDAHVPFMSIPEDMHALHPAVGLAAHRLLQHSLQTGDLDTLLRLHHLMLMHSTRQVHVPSMPRHPRERTTFRDTFGAFYPLHQAIGANLADRQLAAHALSGGGGSDSRPDEVLPEDYYALQRKGVPCR